MLSKSSLKKLNLVILISIFIISISPIVFSGVIYRKTDMIFANKGSWRHTAALQVSTVSVIFFNTIVSFLYLIVFSNNKIFGIISIIITLLSSLLSIAIGIFELVGSVVYNNELTQSCSEDYYGFFETFRYMESYFKVADQLLCSKECPCKFKKIKGYDDFKYGNNGFYSNYLNTLVIDNENGASNFNECSFMSKASVFSKINTKESVKKIGNINYDDFNKFAVFYGRIEKKFKCSAWCKTSYYDEYEKEEKKYYKYIFSDISNGVVKNIGCMNKYRIWLVRFLKAYGSLVLIDGVFQFVLFVFGIMFYKSIDYDDDNDNNESIDNEN